MPIRKSLIAALILFSAGALVSSIRMNHLLVWRFPMLKELMVSEDDFAGDLGSLVLGSHRFAADVAYIQLLQYYGVARGGESEEFEYGNYPLFKTFALRILRLDPFFNGAIIEAAGCLGFIEKKTPEALEYLTEAIERDPSYFRYHLYVTAMLYKGAGKDDELIKILEQAVDTPDCPALFQSVLGNLFRKYGQFEKAARLYLRIALTAPSPAERADGLRRTRQLIKEHPDLEQVIGPVPVS